MTTQTRLEPSVKKHLAGHWYWADLHTSDLDSATAFYTRLFGWETDDTPVGDGVYRMASRGGQTMAALMNQRDADRDAGIQPHWFCYVTTMDLEASTARVAELGGTVIEPPFDVMDVGRMSIVMDPTGAAFALWQTIKHPGTSVKNAHGSLCWFELITTDDEAALGFYTGLFDYDVETHDMGDMTYYVLNAGGEPACGLMKRTSMMGDAPSRWGFNFAVDDVDQTTAFAKELGADVLFGPQDIPNVGRFSSIRDPQGATFSLFKPLPQSGS